MTMRLIPILGFLSVLPAILLAFPTKRAPAITWSPPSNLVTPLTQVWNHEVATYNMNFRNFGYDQLIAANGTAKVCVRWESTSQSVTEAQRAQVQTAIQRSYKKWIDWLVDFEGFPYRTVPLTVVGWAVSNTGLLQGSTSGLDVYTNRDSGGIPECNPACGRFFHQDNNYSSCPGGAARHYDFSVWLTPGFGGGAGGDWGARIATEYFMSNLNTDSIHILLHEIGHYFALDDFYDWTPSGVTNFIMLAGSSTVITDFDGWMVRDWWRHLKSRYGIAREQGSPNLDTGTGINDATPQGNMTWIESKSF